MTRYKQLQILKHALMYYMRRPNSTPDDLKAEESLLREIETGIEFLQERYRIPKKTERDNRHEERTPRA